VPGSGLGLAVVAQQAELHGGRAYAETAPLGGTRIVIDMTNAATTLPTSDPKGPRRR
jgi:signal transduction histidine kinase